MEGLVMLVVLCLLGIPVLVILLLVWLAGVRRRVSALESQVAWLRHRAEAPPAGTPAPAASAGTTPPPTQEPTLSELLRQSPAPMQPVSPRPATAPIAAHAPSQANPTPEAFERAAAGESALPPPLPPQQPAPSVRPARGSRRDGIFDTVRRWFTVGNVPVKVGVLVLFAGVAALLKYATEQGLLQLPIELRLAGVALAATAALVFGWRQRDTRRSFGRALQGGAIGVLLLVIFAASKLYGFLPPGVALAVSAALVAGLGVLAVRQDALALAVLGVLAGFLAPIWLSTGQGSHVALFSYYAVLNAGIVAMAWRRPWRLLNLLGFAFTFGIGSLWGASQYRPEDFASAEPFLVLFFAMYVAIPILYAAAKGPSQRRVFDGSLIFGTPLVAFALQAAMLRGDRLALAFCALGLGALYALLAAAMRRREHFSELVAPYAVLSVGFATLAVPLALSARATAAVFALEGAGLVWLGLRQSRVLPQLAGIALQAASAYAFALAIDRGVEGPAVFNATFMTALLIAVGGFATAFAARLHEARGFATAAYLWGLAWWLGLGFWEIDRSVAPEFGVDAVQLFVLGTALAAAEVARRHPASALHATAALALLVPVGLVWAQVDLRGQPLAGIGALASFAQVAIGWRVLTCLRDNESRLRAVAHIGWLFSLALLASLSLDEVVRELDVGGAWRFAAAALPWLGFAAFALLRPKRLEWPFGAPAEAWRGRAVGIFATVLAGLFVTGLLHEGVMSPLPYVPLLDPVELVQIAALVLAYRFARVTPAGRSLVAGAGFMLMTSIVLRANHHWGDVPWSAQMLSTGAVQTSLTVLWSLIGMAAWVSGSRGQRRTLWKAGAVLMALVLAKLVLVDRQYLGNLLGIGSFIAFGLLCTAVGYLAPVPPHKPEATA